MSSPALSTSSRPPEKAQLALQDEGIAGDEGEPLEGGGKAKRAAEGRSGGPFGGMSAAEAGRLSVEARRERKRAREAEAELDKLTVQQRFATALARKLTYTELESVIGALVSRAREGSNPAAKLLLDYLRVASGGDDPLPPDVVPWDEMSAAQRAAARARLLREIGESTE